MKRKRTKHDWKVNAEKSKIHQVKLALPYARACLSSARLRGDLLMSFGHSFLRIGLDCVIYRRSNSVGRKVQKQPVWYLQATLA